MATAYREMPYEPPELQVNRLALARARQKRWAKLLNGFSIRAEIMQWAARMSSRYGPKVQVRETIVDWLTALYVVRYGENEAYWPPELSDADLIRAHEWEAQPGKKPSSVQYLEEEP